MIRNLWTWILTTIFGVKTQTKNVEIENNEKYLNDYKRIDNINFNAIFSKKLANYTVNDSSVNVEGTSKRAKQLDECSQKVWRKLKKIVSMAFGTGGIFIVPYVKNGKVYYNLVEQSRVTIDNMDGEDITGATILSEIKEITNGSIKTIYIRWSNYTIDNENVYVNQKFTNENGTIIDTPECWSKIDELYMITNTEKCPFGYVKSPVDNRSIDDKYGVPITYGCEPTINEIKECLKQIAREFKLKEAFVGTDFTMFNKDSLGDYNLPKNGLFKTYNSDNEQTFWEVFDPAIRESSYYARLKELYERLETEVGTSTGILSKTQTVNATATEIKQSMYDTFTLIDDMRSSVEEGINDYIEACNILSNAFISNINGEYKVLYDWDYSLLEDAQEGLNNLSMGVDKGVISKAELRNNIKSSETLEESQKAVDEITKANPSLKDLLGNNKDDEE